jgi:hypothetical protein
MPAPESGESEALATVKARLKALWEGQDSEIVTAEIRYRLYRTGGREYGLSRQKFNSLLELADLLKNPDGLKVLIEGLLGERVQLDAHTNDCEFYTDGTRTREQNEHRTLLFDGDNVVRSLLLNNQTNLKTPSSSSVKRMQLRDFRLVPPTNVLDRIAHVESLNGVLELSAQGGQLIVNEATGLVEHLVQRSDPDTVRSEVFQFGSEVYPGDIVFPEVVVRTSYESDQLYSVSVILIQDAQFNQDLPEELFAVAVAAGNKVFDYREVPDDPEFIRVQEPVDDVVQHVEARRVRPPVEAPLGIPSRLWFMLGAASLIGAAIVLLLLFRRFRAARGTGGPPGRETHQPPQPV